MFWKYLLVFSGSMLKFIFGPIKGFALKLHPVEVWLLTSAGMMATVIILTYAGSSIKNWHFFKKRGSKKKKVFTTRKRTIVKVWRKYGLYGVAFLTPLLFSPIGGTLIALAFNEKKHKIIFSMLLSALFWGGAFSFLGNNFLKYFNIL